MQAREKKLAIGLGAVLAAWFGLPVIEGTLIKPLTDVNNELALARRRFEQRSEERLDLRKSQSQLREWRYESLPPDPFTAQREYAEWLVELAEMHGVQQVKPTLARPAQSRGKSFVEVVVTLTGQGTLEQLSRFLSHLERVALLQRVDRVKLTSLTTLGDPLLNCELTLRGLSLPDAPPRQHLFPRARLREAAGPDATELAIEPQPGFPLVGGFWVKIGHELAAVTEMHESTWTVSRGIEGTAALAHEAGEDVELFPADRGTSSAETLSARAREPVRDHPFTKPGPPIEYVPRLSPLSPQVVTRGTPWEMTLSLTGWDPAGGTPQFALGSGAPPRLTVQYRPESQGAQLAWDPPADVAAQPYEVQITASSARIPDQQVTVVLPVRLREPNLAPQFAPLAPLTAFSARPVEVAVQATDPDTPPEQLTYALAGTVPAGAQIDAKSGRLRWVPPITLELGSYPMTVTVSDGGDPEQSASVTIPVTLVEDDALHTYLVGYFNRDGQAEAIFYNRATNAETVKRAGEPLKIADVEGEVTAVEYDHVRLKIKGEEFRLNVDQCLRQLSPVAKPAVGASEETASPRS